MTIQSMTLRAASETTFSHFIQTFTVAIVMASSYEGFPAI